MPTYINKDFEPNESTLLALQKDGITKAFLDQCVTKHFMEYWTELKEEKKDKGKKTTWQTTYRNWARRAFQGKVGRLYEENMHKRSGPYGGLKTDLFEKVGNKLQGIKPEPKKAPPQRYNLPPPPEAGPAMDPMEAMAQLRSILRYK